MTTNNCQGLIYTCEVETDGFGTDQDFDATQRARLDRLKQQYREWSRKYSQRETMDVDEYIQGLDEMVDMSSELDAIMKQTGPIGSDGRPRSMSTAGALVYYDAESGLLNNISSAQTQYLRVGINVAPDHPLVAQNRWDSILQAMAMMKSAGMGGPRAAIGANRIASMRRTVAAWRGRAQPPATPPAAAARPGAAINAKPLSVASSTGHEAKSMKIERKIERGEKVEDLINEAKARTFQTGNEHAVVTLANGERVLVSGGPGGINFEAGSISRIFGHTHPTNALPSAADAAALRALGQSKQYVFHGGQVSVVRSGH
jgi:hypothetical protein